MSGHAIALRHVAFEHLGVIEPVLRRRGWAVRSLDIGAEAIPDAAVLGADLLIVLGGPVSVGDDALFPILAEEKRLIAERLAAGRPTLGICLGAQLMAAALGARVASGDVTEIGFVSDVRVQPGSVLAPLAGLPLLQWHGDTFELPEGATRLASSEHYENQAFALGDHGLALQFHPEVGPGMLEQWLLGNAVELAQHGINPLVLRAAGAEHAPAQTAAFERVLDAWLDALPTPEHGPSSDLLGA